MEQQRDGVLAWYRRVRSESERLCRPLAIEDYVVQAAAEVSPPKWHLGHTSWFFETFLLRPFLSDYREAHSRYNYLFNSYYDSVGPQFPRPRRGTLSRPTVSEVYQYRAHVDLAMERLIASAHPSRWGEIERRLQLGLNHEQQHQELLLTDIKHNFADNPLRPAYHQRPADSPADSSPLRWIAFPGGVGEVGHAGEGFCYDNELPRHRLWLEPFRLAARPVTNGEYMEFMADDGYGRPQLWLADGWAAVLRHGWQSPLYWERRDGEWWQMTLSGMRPLMEAEPVCHVSYYEADAYARWSGKRLPREGEWEQAAAAVPVGGNLRQSGRLHPAPDEGGEGMRQLFGDVWEWTQSPYTPYPGYRAEAGAFGEYNGKFMCGQMVLRGGSCVTPAGHLRPSYRNFFYPWERWQFVGIRLAE